MPRENTTSAGTNRSNTHSNGGYHQMEKSKKMDFEDFSENAIENARHAFGGIKRMYSDALRKVNMKKGAELVKEYPIQTAVGGLLVGFLVGALAFRRSTED